MFLINYDRVRTGHWKTLKVMKFKKFIFQSFKVMEIKVLFVTMVD